MPGIFYQPISRKNFIKSSLGMAAALSVPTYSWGDPSEEVAHWALLSDTHVAGDKEDAYRNFKPYKNLQTIVPNVIAARAQGVVINGDIARLSGEPADYQCVKELLKPLASNTPVHMTLGNHDDRNHFTQVFSDATALSHATTLVEEKYVQIIETPPVRMILLDSLLYVNKAVGLLGKKQRSWLEMLLDSAEKKATVLFVHHTLGDDDIDLQDVDRLFGIIRPHPSVKAIFYGHSHQYKYDQREGIHLINLPAVGYNFTDDQPLGWVEAKMTKEGGNFTLHAFGGDQTDDGATVHLDWR